MAKRMSTFSTKSQNSRQSVHRDSWSPRLPQRKDFKGLRLVTKPGTPSPEYCNAFPTRDGRAQSNLKNSLIANLVYVVLGSIANIPANDLCCVLWVVCVVYCSRDLDRRVNIRFRPKSFDLQNQLFLTLKIDYWNHFLLLCFFLYH